MFLAKAPFWLRWLYPQLTWHMSRREKYIYLTFDDGPTPEITPWVLQTLKQHNIKATFFLLGKNILQYPHIYRQILEEGHAVGNHTFDHPNGWNTATDLYLSNIKQCATELRSTLFRPPYGKIRRSAARALQKEGYTIVMWDIITGDFDPHLTPADCYENVRRYAGNGSILVFHDSVKAWKNMPESLSLSIDFLLEKGYGFKTL